MKRILIAAVACLWAVFLSRAASHNAYPIPEERGTAGVLQALERLPVSARVLWVQAHPDDESAGTITWLARHAYVRTAIYSFTRGEGGQNILGDEKYDALAVVRTGEFLEACRIYGVELYFGGQPDFGFSKTAEETFRKWGRDKALQGLVSFIRAWKPHVIISSFRGDSSDGHGHHQASGILAREAFRAAAEGGAGSWKAARFFVRGSGPGAVQIPVGAYDPVLGRSYREIGAEGYARHRTQSMGASYAAPGLSYDSFRLVAPEGVELARGADFLSGLPTWLSETGGQNSRSSNQAQTDHELAAVQENAADAARLFTPKTPADSLPPLIQGIRSLNALVAKRSGAAQAGDLVRKLRQFEDAANAVLGIYLTAGSGAATAVPGETVPISVRLFNRGSQNVTVETVSLQTPTGWNWTRVRGGEKAAVAPGQAADTEFSLPVPGDADPTSPYTPVLDYPNRADLVAASVRYRVADTPITIECPVRARAGEPIRGVDFVDFQVVPALSAGLTPEVTIVPLDNLGRPRELRVTLTSFQQRGSKGSLRLDLPAGWLSEPERADFELPAKGDSSTIQFRIRAAQKVATGIYGVEAVATSEGREYRSGIQVISYPEIWTRYLSKPAKAAIRVLDLKVAPNLTVGYVPGTGDQLPDSLRQMGIQVEGLSGDDLAFADLSRFSAVVTGIRAYNVNQALRSHNRRLLKYVEDGGTVIVQYNTPMGDGFRSADGSPFPFAPFPMANSTSDRITVEESPVSVIAPDHPALLTPNKIIQQDFDGWVQERGLYFMRSWDPRYTPLLSGGDPGEGLLKGGLLVARVGKGWYVFTGYAWFRQLPAGVPGAYRIFANLLSLGRQ